MLVLIDNYETYKNLFYIRGKKVDFLKTIENFTKVSNY